MADILEFPQNEKPDPDLVGFMEALLPFHSVEAILRAMLEAATEYSDKELLQGIVDKL